VHLLTLDGRRRQRPEFKEGQTGGWPWWPARTSRRCGVPVSLRRRGWLAGVQLVEDVLPAASGGSGWSSRRRTGRRPELQGGGGVCVRAAAAQGAGAREGAQDGAVK
jgi:hypothetical protein